jgi:hypothetical protein
MSDPKNRKRFAKALLVVCVIGWPATALTIFSQEPQGILGLSWTALILTALDILATTDTREQVDDE